MFRKAHEGTRMTATNGGRWIFSITGQPIVIRKPGTSPAFTPSGCGWRGGWWGDNVSLILGGSTDTKLAPLRRGFFGSLKI